MHEYNCGHAQLIVGGHVFKPDDDAGWDPRSLDRTSDERLYDRGTRAPGTFLKRFQRRRAAAKRASLARRRQR